MSIFLSLIVEYEDQNRAWTGEKKRAADVADEGNGKRPQLRLCWDPWPTPKRSPKILDHWKKNFGKSQYLEALRHWGSGERQRSRRMWIVTFWVLFFFDISLNYAHVLGQSAHATEINDPPRLCGFLSLKDTKCFLPLQVQILNKWHPTPLGASQTAKSINLISPNADPELMNESKWINS